MKAKIRIKLLQEAEKAKNITLIDKNITKSESFRLRKARDNINNKILFYKMVNRIIEKSDKND